MASDKEPAIKLVGLRRVYGDRAALDDVTLETAPLISDLFQHMAQGELEVRPLQSYA